MSVTSAQLYNEYRQKMRRLADIRYASAILQWDQETYLPSRGAEIRGQQIATLSEISHQVFADEELGRILYELQGRDDLGRIEKKNLAQTLEDYEKNKKYSAAFVRRMSETVSRSFHDWMEARRQNDFRLFSPVLAELVQLKKEEAGLLGYEQHPYNALLNEFEKGASVNMLDQVFGNLKPALGELLEKIVSRPQVDNSFLRLHFPADRQWAFGMDLLRQLHFDFEAGRQDRSEHPFTINFNSADVRITTRIDENDFGNMTWSCIHELGHALYEQGLPLEEYGLPASEPISFSIHESQSRLWENNVGRGAAFWTHQYPILQKFFPAQLGPVDRQAFYRGINQVQPSLIRTEADEITYHFHVMVRYELEKKLMDNSLDTADIPAFWNEQYRQFMDVKVPDDRQGCLQDVHWSHGSFGYFPTYSLGSLYAAQFYAAAARAIPDLDDRIARGETSGLLQWLRTNVHIKGKTCTSEELCAEITGQTLDAEYFIQYCHSKYGKIYGFD